jgi:hypothetical protein
MKQRLQEPGLPARTAQALCACAFGAATVFAGATLLAATPASASELVTNGGFEDRSFGDFTGWVQPSLLDFSSVECPGPAPVDPTVLAAPQGDCYGSFGAPIGGAGTIAQGLNTTPGTNYRISFLFDSDGLTPNSLDVTWDGTSLLSLADIPATGGFVSRTLLAQATNAITTLAFDLHNDNGFLHLDAVSVAAAAAVPEPDEMALMGLALAALALSRRSRRSGFLPPEE